MGEVPTVAAAWGIAALVVRLTILRRRTVAPEKWAGRRGLGLPVGARTALAGYLAGRDDLLRAVCALGAGLLAVAFPLGTGLDPGLAVLVWCTAGWLAGTVLAERRRWRFLRAAAPPNLAPGASAAPGRRAGRGGSADDNGSSPRGASIMSPRTPVVAASTAAGFSLPVATLDPASPPDGPPSGSGSGASTGGSSGWPTLVAAVRRAATVEIVLTIGLVVFVAGATRLVAAVPGATVAVAVVTVVLPVAAWTAVRWRSTTPIVVPSAGGQGAATVAGDAGDPAVGDGSRDAAPGGGAAGWAAATAAWVDTPVDAPVDVPVPVAGSGWGRALRAVAVIAVAVAALAGLRVWGPLNPEVRLAVEDWPATTSATGTVTAVVTIENASGSAVDVSGVDARPATDAPVRSAPQVVTATAARADGQDASEQALPVRVAAHERARLLIRLDRTVPWCPGHEPLTTAEPAVVVQVDSVLGRRQTVVQARPAGGSVASCAVILPEGPTPNDPLAAQAAIEAAFATVYSGPPDVARKKAVVQGGDDLDAVMRQTVEGPLAPFVAMLKVKVNQVAFDRPDHVNVVYELTFGGYTAATQRGEGVLVDGHWKLARATVCQDLAKIKNPCP